MKVVKAAAVQLSPQTRSPKTAKPSDTSSARNSLTYAPNPVRLPDAT
jgi:hypothetical protein